MTKNLSFLQVGARVLVKTSLVLGAVVIAASPASTYAATYAYVNTSGDVSAVIADTWQAAIATALNIAVHSGVLLLVNPADGVLGDKVGGV